MDEKPKQRERTGRSNPSSPEFEFNPCLPSTHLLSADELFIDGVLRPLHLLPKDSDPSPENLPASDPSPSYVAAAPLSTSKRWTDVFRVGAEKKGEEKKRRERKVSGGAPAEQLNINIWPFTRSRSAGNATAGVGSKSKLGGAAAARKVSSAPCSRSNSRGESAKYHNHVRRFAASPSRGGVHVGRASPVRHLRKKAATATAVECGSGGGKKGTGGGGVGIRVLNLNVNTCIGYRQRTRITKCGGESKIGVTGGDGSVGGSRHFNLRTLFSKKVF